MNSATQPLMEAALRYAELGYSVFPCKSGLKEPLTRNGYHDATSDLSQIRAWWGRQPHANVAIAMRASGLVAVDPDLYKPDCGWIDFIAGKNVPATWQQNTARGGLHLIFRAPPDANFPGKLTRHVEVKWDGYIIAAPSVFGQGQYAQNNLTPVPAPDWLLNAAGFSESGSGQSQKLDWTTHPATGLVVDGRENYLTRLIYIAYLDEPDADAEIIADEAWQRYLATTDSSRPSVRATRASALKKAYHILKVKPAAKGPRLIKGIPPVSAIPELSPQEAIKKLDDEIHAFVSQLGWTTNCEEALALDLSQLEPASDDMPPRALIAGAAGLGKSRRVLDYIRRRNVVLKEEEREDFEPRAVWYLAPTIALCEELAAAYGPGAVVVKGRLYGQDNPDLKTPCDRPKDVQALTAAGITNVASSLCQSWVEDQGSRRLVTCPFRYSCGYYAQFETGPRPEVYFMTHDHLYTPLSYELVERPYLLVIDESPIQKLVSTPRGFAPEAIEKDELGGLIVAELRAGRDPRAAAFAAGWTKASIRKHATDLEGEPPEILPDMDSADIKRRLKNYKPLILPRVLRKFSDELAVEHSGIRCLSYSDSTPVTAEDGSKSKAERIWLHYRKNVRTLRNDLPVLVLDATGDASLLAPSFPGISQVTIAAARNAAIGQTYGFTASMGKMNGEQAKHREEIAAFLRMLASHHETGLLVTYKEAEQYIELPSDKWASEHFGNLRGIDKHKDRSVIVVVGRLQVDPVHMEKMALGLFYDSALPITLTGKYEKRPVGFNMRNGAQNGVETDRHVCPIVDAVRWQHTEAEIIQAVDRLRLVHRPDKAAVYLMNEVPTSIAIDKLRSYREAVGRQGDKGAGGGPGWKLLQAYSELGNVLPASPEWLAKRFPHLWRSPNAAKMALRDYKKRTGNELGTLFGGARGFQLVMGKRRAASFLIWAPDPATAEAFHDANFE